MKLFYLLFFFLLSLVSSQRSDGKSIIYGKIAPGDHLLMNVTEAKEGHFLRTQSGDYQFATNGEIIHAIRLTDNNKPGERGYANIAKGGVGSTNLSIHLRSQSGEGYSFTIEVFGR